MGRSAQAGGDRLLTVASSPSPSHVPPQCTGRDVGKRAVEKSPWARRNLRECLYILFLPSPQRIDTWTQSPAGPTPDVLGLGGWNRSPGQTAVRWVEQLLPAQRSQVSLRRKTDCAANAV